jgi:XK-related protein
MKVKNHESSDEEQDNMLERPACVANITEDYTCCDLIQTLWGAGSYIADYVTDWMFAYSLHQNGNYIWFRIMVLSIVLPQIIIMLVNLWLYPVAKIKGMTVMGLIIRCVVSVFLHLGPVLR